MIFLADDMRVTPMSFGAAAFCFGDGSSVACPCANNGATGRGCQNSAATGGALLSASGLPSLAADTLQFTCSGELSSALSILFQGDATQATIQMGDGLRCAGGHLRRMYMKSVVGGVVSAPALLDPSVSARSAALGDPIPANAIRLYHVYYRDSSAGFCRTPQGNAFNVSNAISILWAP